MPLDQLVRYWKRKEEEDSNSVLGCIYTLKANMKVVREMVYEREKKEKVKQKKYYDQTAKERSFEVGSFVLVFRTTMKDKLMNQWQGPFPIVKALTPVTYQVDLEAKTKCYRTFHINCMREWKSPSVAVFLAETDEWEGLGEERESE